MNDQPDQQAETHDDHICAFNRDIMGKCFVCGSVNEAIRAAQEAANERHKAEEQSMKPAEPCPECGGQGFTVVPDRFGEPDMQQCRTCWERDHAPKPETQSAVEWMKTRMCKLPDDTDVLLSEEDALELARRCDAAEEKLVAAVRNSDSNLERIMAIRAQLMTAQQEATALRAAWHNAQAEAGRLRKLLTAAKKWVDRAVQNQKIFRHDAHPAQLAAEIRAALAKEGEE